MSQSKIDLIGSLVCGYDGELYITTDDGVEHNIGMEILTELKICQNLGDATRVRLLIQKY